MPIQAGMTFQTPAVLNVVRSLVSRGSSRRSGAKKRKSSKRKSTAKRGKRASGGKLKFGSPAWNKKYRVGQFGKKKAARKK